MAGTDVAPGDRTSERFPEVGDLPLVARGVVAASAAFSTGFGV